jgi:hypothetical protein
MQKKCGCKVYDNIVDVSPLEHKAVHMDTINRPATGPAAFETARKAASNVLTFVSSSWNSLSSSLKRGLTPGLSQNPDTSSRAVTGECPDRQNANGSNEHNYLLLCIPFMQYAVKVQHADVCRLRSDQDFFRLLALYYDGLRGSIRSWLTLKELKGLLFVQVSRH